MTATHNRKPRNENPQAVDERSLDVTTASVMIVDDEPINSKVLRKYLMTAGYENFITTEDARAAISMVRRESPDILSVSYTHLTLPTICSV